MSKLADSKTLVSTDPTRVPFKVLAFDLLALGKRKEAEELASLGRKEIQLAEDEMPGLMALQLANAVEAYNLARKRAPNYAHRIIQVNVVRFNNGKD